MINYNKQKYNLIKQIKLNKIVLLEEISPKQKVIAKTSSVREFKNLKLSQDIKNVPKLIGYENDILYIEYLKNTITLEEFLKENISLEQFYNIAIKIVEILGLIHQKNLIHKDINTNNILIDKTTKEIYIIDFELSSSIKEKIDINQNIQDLSGHISFISPEQTGRVNREVDFRSDFYSLGIVFYNLLTSRVPFEAEDLIGVIHQHITKQPLNPTVINKNVPKLLSDLVLKLLAKEPENRYQSINGIKEDLKAIQNGFDITLGEKDFNDKLVLKHSRYGRVEISQKIHDIFQSTIKAQNKLITIGGYSGTGKTSVVHELHKSLSSNFGFYGESKFDQLNSSIPYFGIIKILDEYFEAVLKQEKNITINLKEKLIAKLGDDAFVLSSKIKNLEYLIGKQEVTTKLSTKEEEERFYRAFIVLMEIITDDDKPLLFFVDDLQWADVGTIDLIKLIVQTKTIKNLLIVNAYRDNEVNNNHIYMMMLNSLKETTHIDEFTLENLSKDDVAELVTDLIHTKDTTLIDFFYDMSLGNAFFINQMINLFNSEGLFIFDTENLKFEYDIKKLKAIGLSRDVVEIATKNISLLDDDIIEVLKVASVVGNRFDIELAKSILSETLNIGELLEKAQEKSFIIKIKNQYKFSHDRIQQAFYTLIDKNELPNLHKNIALKLDENQDKIEFFENIKLEMAIHYNHALDILSEDEKIKVVALNLEMAKLLKEALAYDEALIYLDNGLSIIDKRDEELYWEYLFLKIEIYFNTSQIDKIDDIVLLVEPLVNSDEKLVDLANIVIKKDFILNKHIDVINYGVGIIKKLGLSIPTKQIN